ncbi:MAG: ATP-binding protein [Bacteroidota bacterium]
MSQTPKKKRSGFKIYRLGLRISAYSSLLSTLLLFLMLWLIYGLSPQSAVIDSLFALPIFFVVVYAVAFRLQYPRLETLERISKNIAKRRFYEYEELTSPYKDEIDVLIDESVTSSKMTEIEMQRLNKIENYRKEFIGDISHELKTPIFAIQGFIETLLNGALDDDEVNRDFLKKAMRNVNRLIYLTKDLMEISKLETGELKSEIEPVYLFEIVQDVVESLTYKAQKENIQLILHDFDRNLTVYADRNQIKQVVINLIENGIKYNVPNGSVELGLKEVESDEHIFFYVRDTGIGIDEADLPRVTERFFRVDKSRSREKGGTGLGLAIVKHILEAHGEEFNIESKPNMGTTFTISLRKISE